MKTAAGVDAAAAVVEAAAVVAAVRMSVAGLDLS